VTSFSQFFLYFFFTFLCNSLQFDELEHKAAGYSLITTAICFIQVLTVCTYYEDAHDRSIDVFESSLAEAVFLFLNETDRFDGGSVAACADTGCSFKDLYSLHLPAGLYRICVCVGTVIRRRFYLVPSQPLSPFSTNCTVLLTFIVAASL
jgi:hypothetical protein